MHGGTPAYEVTRCPGSASHSTFACRLTAPAVHTPFGGFEEQVFTGHGRIKKAAEHAAAEQVHLLPRCSPEQHANSWQALTPPLDTVGSSCMVTWSLWHYDGGRKAVC